MNEQEIQAIRERVEEATPGAWEPVKLIDGWAVMDDRRIKIAEMYTLRDKEDAEFIAHAREDVPKLIDEIGRLNYINKQFGEVRNKQIRELERLREENQKLNQEIGGYAGDVGKLAHEMEVLSGRLKHDAIKICMVGDPDDE